MRPFKGCVQKCLGTCHYITLATFGTLDMLLIHFPPKPPQRTTFNQRLVLQADKQPWMGTSSPSLAKWKLSVEAPDGFITTSYANKPNCVGSVACAMFGAKMKMVSSVIWNMKITFEDQRSPEKAKRQNSKWLLEMKHLPLVSCNTSLKTIWIERSYSMMSIEKCIRTTGFRGSCMILAGAVWALL